MKSEYQKGKKENGMMPLPFPYLKPLSLPPPGT